MRQLRKLFLGDTCYIANLNEIEVYVCGKRCSKIERDVKIETYVKLCVISFQSDCACSVFLVMMCKY